MSWLSLVMTHTIEWSRDRDLTLYLWLIPFEIRVEGDIKLIGSF